MASSLVDLLSEPVVPCFIGGAILPTSKTYALNSPYTGERIYDVSAVGVADALKAVAAAEAALPAWKAVPPTERRAIFLRAAVILRARIKDLTDIQVRETTSSDGWSAFDAGLAVECFEELAGASTALRGEIAPSGHPGQRAYLTRIPYGVVFGIAPWNAPIFLGTRAVANPIMAGNTCVLKTSEYSPKTQVAIAQVLAEAGLPAGVLNVIHVDPQDAPAVVEAVIAQRAVRKVNFTGSTRVGRIIAEVCGKYLKPCALELGGAAPFIVMPDANLEFAVNSTVFGGFSHSGQACMSTNTLIVHESVAEEFGQRLKVHLAKMKATANSPVLRGVFSTSSAQRLEGLVRDALNKGATVLAGSLHVEGNLVQPLVLAGLTADMRILHEEIFGPIVLFLTYQDEAEAIRLANATEYGLSAAVYSRDTDNAYKIASQIEAGAVHVNGTTIHDQQHMPHGGTKSSGWGMFNGIEGLKEFSQVKIITINEHYKFPV